MTKPLTFQDAFPGRFLTAGHFDGKKVTLTISDVYLDAELDKKKPKLVAKFAGKTLELVINKSNAYCIKELFGNKLMDWVGKKITFFPTTTMFGEDIVECIRVWGSPDISEDKPLKVPQGRKKPVAMTMHAMKTSNGTGAVTNGEHATAAKPHNVGTITSLTTGEVQTQVWTGIDPGPPTLEAWSILGWSREEGMKDLVQYQGMDYLAHLSTLIDEENAKEGAF